MQGSRQLELCPVNIPKSGKKLFKLDGVELFIRPIGNLVFIYDCISRVQLLCVHKDKKNQAFELILKRLDEIKELHNANGVGV